MPQITYSFANVAGSIVGPNGAFSFGYGSGIDDGGITAEMSEDKVDIKTGADGKPMATLHASKLGRITVRVQKTSPLNAFLSALYGADNSSATQVAQNTIVVRDLGGIDVIAGQNCAIAKFPSLTYGREGPPNEWVFVVGQLDMMLGGGGV